MDARSILALAIALAALNQTSVGQEKTTQWWNPMTWNPMAESSSSGDTAVRKSTYFNGANQKSSDKPLLSMPKLPWTSAEQATNTAPAGPSTFSKMGQSTKRAWNNTVDFLNPFEKKTTSQQQGYQPQNSQKTTKAGTGMLGWMWREETTESPTSVNEFLRQERPKF